MRVISGKFKGRRLSYPKDRTFRPTKTIVRESLFSILNDAVVNTTWLDACAGTGAIGFEALSRGAKDVVFVDLNTKYIQTNARLLGLSIQCVRSSISSYLGSATQSFDVIFLDPVWADHHVYKHSIQHIFDRHLLMPGGSLFLEHDATYECPSYFKPYLIRSYQYGHSFLSRFSLP